MESRAGVSFVPQITNLFMRQFRGPKSLEVLRSKVVPWDPKRSCESQVVRFSAGDFRLQIFVFSEQENRQKQKNRIRKTKTNPTTLSEKMKTIAWFMVFLCIF